MTTTLKPLGTREYYLHAPTTTAPGAALFVVLHGGAGNAHSIETGTGFSALADAEGFYVAYPEGTEIPSAPGHRVWNAGTCCGVAVTKQIKDVTFISAVIQKCLAENPINPARVYIGGMSNGAMMAYRYAVEAASNVAACVVVAGTLCIDNADAAKQVPVLHIHGDEDSNVPFAGGLGDGMSGVDYRSVPDTIALLRLARGKMLTKIEHEPLYKRTTWSGGSGAQVQLALIYGGEHAWPTTPINATQEAWAFAKKFKKGA
jgi:polyhydroxybutyrate depolymerase